MRDRISQLIEAHFACQLGEQSETSILVCVLVHVMNLKCRPSWKAIARANTILVCVWHITHACVSTAMCLKTPQTSSGYCRLVVDS